MVNDTIFHKNYRQNKTTKSNKTDTLYSLVEINQANCWEVSLEIQGTVNTPIKRL